MSRLKTHASKRTATIRKHSGEEVENFMGGKSYTINPLDTLKLVSASSIFGEPSYYRKGVEGTKSILGRMGYKEPKESTVDVMTKAIDEALDFNFKDTLNYAVELRNEYLMRMNPAVIFIRSALHKNRVEFNKANPYIMKEVGKNIVNRPDDITNQFEYYMYVNGSKNKLPNIVKRTWAEKLATFNKYQISKYQTKGMLRDLVRISHAHSDVIDELMRTDGVLQLEDDNTTWERLRSSGKTWKEILETIKIPHMALLRNLRGIFSEINDVEIAKEVCQKLKDGVIYGKQFPFRYYTAFKYIEKESVNHKALILDTLEECIDIAMANFPKLKGKTICLSDNSGSAWGGLTTEFGSTVVADIDNLSSFITAYNSDEGYVGYFGDRLEVVPVSKRNGILNQVNSTNMLYGRFNGRNGSNYVGAYTENGIWIFFKNALANKEKYDNIFIYSDMQAGHGGLYGLYPSEYSKYSIRASHIDILKLVEEYRATVNSKVNVFSVQTAGYNNSILPENYYRTHILSGWTGKEALYADKVIKIWDGVDKN